MILNGKEVALGIKEELKKEASNLNPKPSLVVIQVGDDPASNIYVNSKAKLKLSLIEACSFVLIRLNASLKREIIAFLYLERGTIYSESITCCKF